MDYIYVKNWRQFQVYKQRNPPWIRLYRSLLTDDDFHALTDAQKGQLLCIFLLASESVDGCVPDDTRILRSKIGCRGRVDMKALSHFFASTMLAPCKQNAHESEPIRRTEVQRTQSKQPEVQKKPGTPKKRGRRSPKKQQEKLPECDGGFLEAVQALIDKHEELKGSRPAWAIRNSGQAFGSLKSAWKVVGDDLPGCWERFLDEQDNFIGKGALPEKFAKFIDNYRLSDSQRKKNEMWAEYNKLTTEEESQAWQKKWNRTIER